MTLGGGSGLVARPVFKTAMESPPGAPVGSIPTRSRHRGALGAAVVALLTFAPVGVLVGQTPAPAPAPAAVDSLNPLARPVKPIKAFFMVEKSANASPGSVALDDLKLWLAETTG